MTSPEAVGTPALQAAKADHAFETEALAAWEEYQLTGISVPAGKIDKMFFDATKHAKAVGKRHGKCAWKDWGMSLVFPLVFPLVFLND